MLLPLTNKNYSVLKKKIGAINPLLPGFSQSIVGFKGVVTVVILNYWTRKKLQISIEQLKDILKHPKLQYIHLFIYFYTF